jgi:hypothetical protein
VYEKTGTCHTDSAVFPFSQILLNRVPPSGNAVQKKLADSRPGCIHQNGWDGFFPQMGFEDVSFNTIYPATFKSVPRLKQPHFLTSRT